MKSEYDVLVVGAGPAGALAAKTAAENGCSVLLVEKRSEIGVPVRCAEGILHQDLIEFITPNPAWISAEIRKETIVAPNGKCVSFLEDSVCGYILERKLFDRALVWDAVAAGVDVEVKATARPLMEMGKVRGACISQNGNELNIKAQVVIAADGVESTFARDAGISTTLDLDEVASCLEYRVADIDIEPDNLRIYFSKERAPGGYIWVFPKGKRMANIGIGIRGSYSSEGHRAKDYLDSFIQKNYPDGKIMEIISGGVPITHPLNNLCTDNLLVVGDAAHLSDALTGGGIYQALYSGRLAGKTAADAVNMQNTSKEYLSSYETSLRLSGMWQNLHLSLSCKRFAESLTDEELNAIMAEFRDVHISVVTVKSILLAQIKANPKLLLKVPGLLKHLKGKSE